MIVYMASVSWAAWEPSADLGIFKSLKGAKAACDADNGEPLDWSDPTLDGLFDPSPNVWNARNEVLWTGTYTVERVEVKP
jgi:hypothetical protein